MIISRTPYRISLFGGGTDYPAWSDLHGGVVLGGTIDRYLYLTVRRGGVGEKRFKVAYSVVECTDDVASIRHPSVRACLEYLKVPSAEIHAAADLPARSGMGSSSAFTVGLLNALHGLQGRSIAPQPLASDAIHIERTILGETVGSQDQVFAAHGGLNVIEFNGSDINVRPIPLPAGRLADLNAHLMLFYIGGRTGTGSDAAQGYASTLDKRRRELRILTALVSESTAALHGGEWAELGALLHEAWELKRGFGVSTHTIDAAYDSARSAGALGGKLLGAGGGGFLLVFAEPEKQPAIAAVLTGLPCVPFKFQPHGSQIVFHSTEAHSFAS